VVGNHQRSETHIEDQQEHIQHRVIEHHQVVLVDHQQVVRSGHHRVQPIDHQQVVRSGHQVVLVDHQQVRSGHHHHQEVVHSGQVNINMTNQDKAALYEELIRESDALQRANSKLKSEYVTNIPPNIQQIIEANDKKIATIVGKFEQLMR
jgi:hypothetical protein